MQALILAAPSRLEWREQPDLSVRGALEAIVRPIASTMCDLDRRIITGSSPFKPPFPIGHEAVAEVLEIGDKVRTVVPGDLVVVPWHVSCGMCELCRRNLPAHCVALPGLTAFGIPDPINGDWGGLYSEQVRVKYADAMLHKLPLGVDPVAVASASDNLTDAYVAVNNGLTKNPGAPVLIVGGVESLALFAVDLALAGGAARVDYVDEHEGRRAAARGMGAHIHPALPDDFVSRYPVVIAATRNASLFRGAILCLAPGGHLSNLAVFFEEVPMPLWEMFLRDVTMSIGLPNAGPHIPAVLELARCGHIHPERLVTVHPIADAPEALIAPEIKPVLVRSRLLGQPSS